MTKSSPSASTGPRGSRSGQLSMTSAPDVVERVLREVFPDDVLRDLNDPRRPRLRLHDSGSGAAR